MPYHVWSLGWCGERRRGRWHWFKARKPLLVTQPWELLSVLLNTLINAYLSEAPGGLLHVKRFYFTDCPLDKRNLISEPTQKARCALWVYWSGSTTAAVSSNVCAAGVIRNMLHAGCSKLQELNKPDRGLSVPFRANSRVKKRYIWGTIKAIATKKGWGND